MQFYNVWPGSYEFTSNLKSLIFEVKKFFDEVLKNIDEVDAKFN